MGRPAADPDDGEGGSRADRFAAVRHRMVRADIAARGVTDARVLDAMRTVRRDRFVPPWLARSAYEDRPLPIASGQTISQPYVVAVMAERARVAPGDRVLEIGTGSGYGAAVLAHLAGEVWTIERHRELAESARRHLADEGVANVHVVVGDGTRGWPEAAPFDAIVVTAAARDVPLDLVEQLADGGRLVIPVEGRWRAEMLRCITRHGDELHSEEVFPVRFVPLVPGSEPRS